MTKKAYRQRSWPSDKWNLELVVVPEIREVMLEICNAIKSKEGTEEKRGTPPRNPNVRTVVKTSIEMGEFEQTEL